MFAPWCPTCASRMLLGPRRVEATEAGPQGPRVILRCFCGTALVWSAEGEGSGTATPIPAPPAPSVPAGSPC